MYGSKDSKIEKTVSFIIQYTVALLFILGILWFFVSIGVSITR